MILKLTFHEKGARLHRHDDAPSSARLTFDAALAETFEDMKQSEWFRKFMEALPHAQPRGSAAAQVAPHGVMSSTGSLS